MRSLTIVIIAAAIAIFGLVYVVGNPITYVARALNPWYSPVQEHLARAESAQTPEEVTHHLTVAKAVLPESGSVFWWSPEKPNFESIHAELDDIIIRTKNISSLAVEDEMFNSELYAIHAEIRTIQETLIPF